MGIFHSYVSLPEGNGGFLWNIQSFTSPTNIITGNMTYGSYLHVFLQKIIMWGSKGDSVIMSVPQTDVSHFSGKL
jgi:hypothetical protein